MPALDLSLTELRRYAGRTPRPADFDAYWAQALAELDTVDPAVEITPAYELEYPGVEFAHLRFTGTGGARVYAKLVRRTLREQPGPAVVQFHGYGGHSGDWLDKATWAAAGYTVAALDCRGQGGRSEDRGGVQGHTQRGHIIRGLDDPDPQALLYRHIFLDTVLLARIVMDLPGVDPGRVGAMGNSQGGGLTLACAALEPRIRRAAPVFPFLCDYQRVWEMDQAQHAYEELRSYFRTFDPRHEREAAVFTKLGYIDCQHLAPRIRAEVLMFTGLMDNICPPSTQFAAYNKITAPKDMVLYPDFGHEGLPGQMDRSFAFMRGL